MPTVSYSRTAIVPNKYCAFGIRKLLAREREQGGESRKRGRGECDRERRTYITEECIV